MYEARETITIVNRKYNAETGLDEWRPTIITGVAWYGKQQTSVTTNGLQAANTAVVRIPVDADTGGREYMTPAEYKAAESVSGAYTLAPGDLIVWGAVAAGAEPLTPAQIKAAYSECYTILGATDNTRRPRGAHRKVVAA